ncbi:hypothetical protein [uncultured Roseobacter sp.]|uniref:hypothetical protein n=1 Tax=uncultured Roseobacter sp. TaxID=114847 RepID=UPI0026302389|nr:hypothetical protein [uncultured Roseobacter sp.]
MKLSHKHPSTALKQLSASLFFVILSFGANTVVAEPLLASVEPITMCDLATDLSFDQNPDTDERSGDIVLPDAENMLAENGVAAILRARAQGVSGGRRTSRTRVGFRFTPNASFSADFDLAMTFSGFLHDSGGAPALLRISANLFEEGTDDPIASFQPASQEKDGPANDPTASFTGGDASVTFDASLKGEVEYELIIELRASSHGVSSEANFQTSDRGLTVDCLVIEPDLIDSDGDAIFDSWETAGIDANGADSNDIDLDTTDLGTDFRGVPIELDPMRKDVLVEIDYFDCATGGDCMTGDTHTHRPMDSALQRVVDAFAQAPVTNPDGTTGINLWIVISDPLPHQQVCAIDDGCIAAIKQNSIGAAEGLSSAQGRARELIFHYNLFAHALDSPGGRTSGRSDGGDCNNFPEPRWGDDFIVALGNWGTPNGTEIQQAGTFMHELGHNFGLCHGGFQEVNCKPNYLSVMNYSFQTRGIPTSSGNPVVDYSRINLSALDETQLDENAGINGGIRQTYYGPLADIDGDGTFDLLLGNGNGPINWDQSVDGSGMPTFTSFPPGASADINDLSAIISQCAPTPGEVLQSQNDWDALIYDLRSSELSGAGLGAAEGQDIELTADEAEALDAATFWLRKNPEFDYSAKLICGSQTDGDVLRLVRGTYATTINILNPNNKMAEFEKTLVLAYPPIEQRAGSVQRIALDTLPARHALKVDCDDVRAALFKEGFPETDDPGAYIEGFVTLESDSRLDVVGVYTAAPLDADGQIAAGISMDLERAIGRRHPPSPDLEVAKTVEVLGVDGNTCISSQCLLRYSITVRNIGNGDATDVLLRDRLSVTGGAFAGINPQAGWQITDQGRASAHLERTIDQLPSGQDVTFDIQVTAIFFPETSNDPTPAVLNTAQVDGDGDRNLANNTVSIITQ